jgi:cytochrome c5
MKKLPFYNPVFLLLNLFLIVSIAATVHASNSTQVADSNGIKKLIILGGVEPKDLPDPGSDEAKLLATYCNQCHNLPNPKMYSIEEWPERFSRMMLHAEAMGRMPGFKTPSNSEKSRISTYLQKHGMQSMTINDPSLQSPEGFQFAWYCSSCHNLPAPGQHTPEEWPTVLDRMIKYRRIHARPDMSFSGRNLILEFLRRNQ